MSAPHQSSSIAAILRDGFARCADPVLVFDARRIVVCNAAAERLFGRSADEILQQNAVGLSTPSQPDGTPSGPAVIGRLAEARQDGFAQFEWRFRRGSGQDFTAVVTATTFASEGRELFWATIRESAPSRVVETARPAADPPPRKAAPAADRRHGDQDQFFTLSNDLLCVTDVQGNLLRLNAAWEKTLGYMGDALVSKSLFDLLHGDDVALARHEWKKLVEAGRTASLEHRFRCRDGSYRWLLWNASLDPARQRGYAIARDITARKRTELELRRARDAAESANRAKSEFLANMSHEIRTPLNAVLGIASLMRESALTDDHRELVETILRSGQGLLEIVNEVLDFSKVEAGKLELAIGPVDLWPLVEDTCELLAERAHRRGLELVVDIDREAPRSFRGDASRLRQIITNLVGNAIKFTEQGEICVSARAERDGIGAGRLHLEVRDTGIGIPPADQAKIFDAFSQADTSHSRRFGGTGLGLAISRRLVELMGGTIAVESRVGRGSRFWIDVPFSESTAPPADPAVAELAGRTALVVDAHESTRATVTGLLSRWGLETREADAIAAAGEMVRLHRDRARPPIVVVERALPGALATIEHWRSTGAAVVVEMRTLDQMQHAPQPSDVAKPVKADALFTAIRRAVSGRVQTNGAVEQPPVDRAAVNRLRLLLVEDNPVNQLVALKMLRKLGCEADLANNGREAVEALRQRGYDMVLMDCQMPEMDGFEATRVIREAEREGDHKTIIAMTALAMHGDRERCLAAGMDDYLPKPVKIDALRDTLQRWTPRA